MASGDFDASVSLYRLLTLFNHQDISFFALMGFKQSP
jgi:hypothetical protein